MSNELTIPEYLSIDSIKSDLDSQAGLVGSPAALYPSVKMNKDMQGFVVNLGEQIIDRPNEVFFVILGDENFYGSRALFTPGNSGDTTPVCATRLLSPGDKQSWIGTWNDASGHPRPMEGDMRCAVCPWGQFGSEPRWDEAKTGAGPACKERRALYGVRVEEADQRGHFRLVDDTVLRMVLPATSIKTTQQMVAKATAGKVPLSAAVFLLSNKIESRGSIKWSILQAELIGLVGDKSSYDTIQGLRGKVRSVVSGDASLDDSSYIDTSASTATEADDEIPF
tara:strand:+ start:470 stop:1312 length:843 start_codon:yes stop_codon:yes gene_type:complete